MICEQLVVVPENRLAKDRLRVLRRNDPVDVLRSVLRCDLTDLRSSYASSSNPIVNVGRVIPTVSAAVTAEESTPPLRNVPTGTSANDISAAACSAFRGLGPQSSVERSARTAGPSTRKAPWRQARLW